MINLISCGSFSCSKEDEKENQDSILLPSRSGSGYVFAVADGVGSYQGARQASDIAVNCLSKFEADVLKNADSSLHAIKNAISDYVNGDHSLIKAATTLSYCFIDDENLHVVHVGDTRVYVKAGSKLYPLTKDHTQHQEMIDEGIYTKKELKGIPGKNTLTAALSKHITLRYQEIMVPLLDLIDDEGEISLFIMSDGAHSFWEKRPRLSINTLGNSVGFASSLLKRIRRNGPEDDYSLVAVKFKISKMHLI